MTAALPGPTAPRANTATTARRLLTLLAGTLGVIALLVESVTHTCARFFFDPLPDAASIGGYLLLTLALGFNEWVISRGAEAPWTASGGRERFPARLRLLAGLAAAGAGTAVALANTVLFAPLLPIAVLPFSWIGWGFCGLSPMVSLIAIMIQLGILLRRWGTTNPRARLTGPAAAILSGAAAALVLVGRPVATGYWVQRAFDSTGATREAATGRLRALGAESTLLGFCYRSSSPLWVGLGRSLAGSGQHDRQSEDSELGLLSPGPTETDVQAARAVYYLMTGRPFESADASSILKQEAWGGQRWEMAVEEQGGELVGSSTDGLSLLSSRIDGVLDPEHESASCEWTMVFENTTTREAEARAQILLPEGAVVDKVSLWINDEERPAAFGARETVRQAYRDVAIAQRRDPLLVTTRDGGRVLAQCFPVPANGKMKIRLGIAAPLVWKDRGAPRLRFDPPCFQQVNFRLAPDRRHEIWMEGRWPRSRGTLAGEGWSFSQVPAAAGRENRGPAHVARVELPAPRAVDPPSLSITGAPAPGPGDRTAGGVTRRAAPFPAAGGSVNLIVLVDTTRDMRGALDGRALAEALAALPAGSRVRLADSRDAALTGGKGGTGWLGREQRGRVESWLAGRRYEGGLDPVPALEWAWDTAAFGERPAALVWLHGATPNQFGEPGSLAADYERRPDGPVLVGVRLRPGPDALMERLGGLPRVHSLASRGGDAPLAEAVALAAAGRSDPAPGRGIPLGGREPAINGLYLDPAIPAVGVGPMAHLALASRALAPWYAGARAGPGIETARRLAIASRLVTPMSGAVVLETKEQYERYNLDASAPTSSIPSVPEPGTLALLLLAGGLGGGWRLLTRRRGGTESELGSGPE